MRKMNTNITPNYMNSIHNKKKEKQQVVKSEYVANINNIYTSMINLQNQKSHPFGLNEKRFNWSKVSTGDDFNGNGKQKIKSNLKDNLDGGIGNFMNNKLNYNKFMKMQQLKQQKKENEKNKYKFNNIITGRVLNPYLDNEEESHEQHKKRCNTIECLKNPTDGTMSSLINKTPLDYNYKGRRKFNTSVDSKYKRRQDTEFFSSEFLNADVKGIFGVIRKNRGACKSVDNVNIISSNTIPVENKGKRRYIFY